MSGRSPQNLATYLMTPVPNQTLVWLRIAIGLLGGGDILGNGIYYHWYKGEFSGFTFRYYGFEWVHPLPEPFFSLFFVVGFALGIAVALGWRFRITAPLFALAFTYLFLLEKAHYLNHAYLFSWLAWLLVFTPAWREWSLDVRRDPKQWSPYVPRWGIALFPLMMGIVYFWGGIAKINYDWLIEAMPLHLWISARKTIPVVGPLLEMKATAYFMAWGGFLLDSFIAFFLLHKRLRWWALAAALFFHATNHLIFNIGIFPYLSLVMTSLFFEPYWPQNFVRWLGKRWKKIQQWQSNWQARVNPTGLVNSNMTYSGHTPFRGRIVGLETADIRPNAGATTPINDIAQAESLVITVAHMPPDEGPTTSTSATDQASKLPLEISDMHPNVYATTSIKKAPRLIAALSVLILVHLALPLRHHTFPTDVAWSEEGHRYSWRMMLRTKRGYGYFKVANRETGQQTIVKPREELNSKQVRKLYTHPDMILQYAHHLRDQCGDCAVYADIKVKLNHGKYHRYVDPDVDLSQVEWSYFSTKDWVLAEGDH